MAQMLTFNRPRFETVVRTWSAQNVEFLICFWTPRKSMLWTHVVVVWKITFWRKSGNYHTLEELELHWVVRVNTECISDRKNSVNQATSHIFGGSMLFFIASWSALATLKDNTELWLWQKQTHTFYKFNTSTSYDLAIQAKKNLQFFDLQQFFS